VYFSQVTSLIEKKVDAMSALPGDQNYAYKREHFTNESLESLLKNITASKKIKIINGRLEQMVDPIYRTPYPNKIGLRSHFYAHIKPVFGVYVPTFWFNIVVIWLMSIVAFVALYFEWLLRFIDRMSRVKMPKVKIPIVPTIWKGIVWFFSKLTFKKKVKLATANEDASKIETPAAPIKTVAPVAEKAAPAAAPMASKAEVPTVEKPAAAETPVVVKIETPAVQQKDITATEIKNTEAPNEEAPKA
jgi:hypothetical protein